MRKKQFRLKHICASLLLAFTTQTTQANPIGAAVINGQASFATSGNTLTVTNTPGAIINWQGFSIGANEITRFAQQSASSAVLNRVIANNPSNILGSLQSNGRVFLVNPSGIVFGAGATINVAGLVATSLNMSNADFLAGRYNFTNVPGAQNISNAGNLTAQNGGQIYLIAPNVENTGIVNAPNGEILLAAGHSVELVNSNDPNLRVNITAPAGDATNVGQLVAESGSLGLFGTVVRNSGTASADSATLQGGKIVFKASQRVEAGGTISTTGTSGGSINLQGDAAVAIGGVVNADGAQGGTISINAGSVSMAGTLTARGSTGQGGSIDIQSETTNLNNVHATLDASGATGGSIREIAGQQITSSATYLVTGTAGNGGYIGLSAPATKLLSAQLDASGTTGGGQIRVGGEYQGGKSTSASAPSPLQGEGWGRGRISTPLPNAETLAISNGSVIKADATQQGDGGTVILWSDLESALYANVSAQPAGSGQGGFIELSSAEKLLWGGSANAGVGGQVLMDPKNIVIQDATAGSVQYNLTLGYNYIDLPRMKGNDLEAGDFFGSDVSLSGTQLAVGAFGDGGSGNVAPYSGAVYLFNNPYTTPTLSGIIGKGYTGAGNYDVTALEVDDWFGYAVSLSGTQLAVGASGDGGSGNAVSGSGAVYLFNTPFSTPTLSGIIGTGYTGTGNYDLTALEAGDNFGHAVSLSGTQLAVGAYGDDGSGNLASNSGAVYLFSNPYTTPALSGIIGTGYTGTGDYNLAALGANDYFGSSVSLSGTQLAVGSYGDGGSGNAALDSGAVYLFNNPYTTPALSGIIGKGYGTGNYDLTALEAGDSFGSAVSLSGTQLAVGAFADDGFGNATTDSGAVYLFNTPFSTPTLSGIIGKGYTGTGNYDLSALEAYDNFGISVSLSGTQLAVGAYVDDGSGNAAPGSGAVYLFNTPYTTPALSGIIGKGYTGAGSFDVSALETSDWFGSAVSLSVTQLAVGAPMDDGSGNVAIDSGAVYLFDNPYTAPTLSGIIGKGYTGAGNYDLAALEMGDQFGSAVSLSGTQLAVGAPIDDGSGNVAINSGAVYLFDNPFSPTPTLSSIIGKGYTGTGNYDLTALETSDWFGSTVSLSGTQLAVGAYGDGGFGNLALGSGAVYLFSNPFSATPTLSGIIGKGYTGAGDYDLAALEMGDQFGHSVSLSGTQLAVGAYFDGGSGNVVLGSGAVYLFNNPYTAPALSGIIGKGYTGAGDYDLAALEMVDQFGHSVSLSGTQLAVGAYLDDGSGNVATNSGAVYLFDTPYTAPALSGIIGKGYTGTGNYDLTALEMGDQFGSAVSLSGLQLAVGAYRDDGAGNAATDSGAVYLFTLVAGIPDPATGQTFSTNSGTDSSITPASITAILDTGTALTLQASNDITLTNAIIANNLTGNGGALTLQAGRSILVNAGITTDNGALALTANDTLANGVVTADRDAGAAQIALANGVALNAGTGSVTLQVLDGAGRTGTQATAGDISLNAGSAISAGATLFATPGNLNAGGTVSTGTFTLGGGTWNQVAATLPTFTANDFGITGGTFIRALGGDGTAGTPYQLADIYGVQGMGSSGMLGKSYTLVNNIDAAGTVNWNAGAGFVPVGNATTKFTGTFDGQNRTIGSLTINRPTTDYVGLFGYAYTGPSAAAVVIQNVGLVGGSLIGRSNVGGLVGSLFADSMSANVSLISNSYITGSVNGNGSSVGGVVGTLFRGTVKNSYATGNVSGGVGNYVGGLVGAEYDGLSLISNSYASGSVSGTGLNIGGLLGFRSNGTITNSFWDITTSGQETSAGGTSLTTAQMMQLSSFSSWNTATPNAIANTGGSGAVWRIYEGHTAPLLTSFMTGLTLTGAPDASLTYNGSAQSGAAFTLIANVLGAAATGTNAGFYNGYYSTQQGYDLTGGNLTITQLASVAYTGASGNWSTAANWAGGALPDGANVAAVTIPSGVTVTYDSGVSGTTTLNTLTNSGSLAMAAGTLSLGGTSSISAYSQTGGTLNVTAGTTTLTNASVTAGTIGLSGTGTLNMAGAWSNAGSFNVAAGTINLGGTFTTAGLGTFTRTGGAVNITGTLDNTGAIYDLSAAGSLGSINLVNGGTLKNGTVTSSGAASITVPAGQSVTLDNMTLGTDMVVNSGGNVTNMVTVPNTLTLANNATVSLNAVNAGSVYLNFSGASTTPTLTGTGTVTTSSSANGYWAYIQPTTVGSTLTIGSGITINGGRGVVGNADYASSTYNLINQGTINASTAGTSFSIYGTNWQNSGTITASAGSLNLNGNWTNAPGALINANGSTLDLNGTWQNNGTVRLSATAGSVLDLGGGGTWTMANLGTFDRAGGTLNINGILDLAALTGSLDLAATGGLGSVNLVTGGRLKNGTVTSSGAASLTVPVGQSVTLDNMTLGTDMVVNSGGNVTNMVTVPNTLTLANNATVSLNAVNAGSVYLNFSGASTTPTLTGTGTVTTSSSANGYWAYIQPTTVGSTLTIGSGITINGGRGVVGNADYASSTYNLINQGTINASTAGTSFSIYGTNWQNSGTISSVGTTTLAGTTFTNNGTLAATAGTMTVSPTTFTQSGTINVATGATFNRTAGFTNTGTLSGTGTIVVGTGASKLVNQGNINPGGTGATGTLAITGDVQLSTGSNLNMELGGTTAGLYDKLAVTGIITNTAGALNASLLAGYTPTNADAIPFMTMGGTASGTFTTTSLPAGFSAGYNLAAGEAARLIYATPGLRTFTNTSGGLTWETAGNWVGSVLPGSSETALISSGYAVTHGSGTDSIAALTINSGNSLDVSGGSLTVSGATNVGGTLTVSVGGALSLNGASSVANLTMSGGTLSASGGMNATTFTMNGGTWNQVAASLPSLTVNDFRLNGGTFIRALGGDGTTATPYQLADIYGVQGMASAGMLGKVYTLANNIDASGTVNWNAGAGFVPVGGVTASYLTIPTIQFSGTFDGLGHTINNLTINRPTTSYVGLFGYTTLTATISNVGLVGGTVSAYEWGGFLAGENFGAISNSYATGNVTAIANYAGGLVGINYGAGTVTDSYATGNVSSATWAGGLTAWSNGMVSNSYATGNVTGTVGYVGGLMGENKGTLSNSYATGNVVGPYRVGGLVGYAYTAGGSVNSTISNSYATGSVTSTTGTAGGLVGDNEGTINNSYATGSVSGTANIGGLVGFSSGTATNSFWNTTTSGQATSAGGTGLTTAQMQQMSSFTGWNIANTGGSGAVWRIYEGHTAPLLTSFLTPLTLADAAATYNGVAQSGTTTALASVLGTAATGTNAGNYSSGYYSTQQGYDISGGNLTVNKAALTVTADNTSRIFGAANPTFTSTITGYVNGENASTAAVTGAPSLTTTANTTTPVGTASIVTGAGNLAAGNYTFTTLNNGVLTIAVDQAAADAAAAAAAQAAAQAAADATAAQAAAQAAADAAAAAQAAATAQAAAQAVADAAAAQAVADAAAAQAVVDAAAAQAVVDAAAAQAVADAAAAQAVADAAAAAQAVVDAAAAQAVVDAAAAQAVVDAAAAQAVVDAAAAQAVVDAAAAAQAVVDAAAAQAVVDAAAAQAIVDAAAAAQAVADAAAAPAPAAVALVMDMMVSNIVAVPVINIPSTPLTPPVLTQASVPPTPAPVANAPADTASAEPGSTDSNDKREAEESVIVADATGPAAAPIAAAPLPVCN